MALHLPLSCLDFLEREDSAGADGVVHSSPQDEVAQCAVPSLLPQYDQFISHTDLFNALRDFDLRYRFNLLRILPFGHLRSYKASLGIGVLVRK